MSERDNDFAPQDKEFRSPSPERERLVPLDERESSWDRPVGSCSMHASDYTCDEVDESSDEPSSACEPPANRSSIASRRQMKKVEIARGLPQPVSPPEPVPAPEDVDFPGLIRLEVDTTDIDRRIYQARETIPVAPGPITLLYPQWLPGYHSPRAPIELFAGLQIRAGGEEIAWRRHPTQICAFQLEVPDGHGEIEATFQFLSPTASDQGRVLVTPDVLNLEWNTVLLYPAGYFARRIVFRPTLTLPEGWQLACALEGSGVGSTWHFEPVSLDELVDSPVFAGRYFSRFSLDEAGAVQLNVFADRPELLNATDDQIEPHRELVRQVDRLFGGVRHFDHYDVLLTLSDEIGSIGVEHHRSCEAVSVPGYFTQWEETCVRRNTVPHEYFHSWNGKYRRGADSWSASFDEPIRNSLMWVYEGQTQYWDHVLSARSGLWTREIALQAFAQTAAIHDVRQGSRWRPMSDTTRDPIISERSPLPWPSWQRSEDYYTEGSLVWLDVDTRVRELTGETRSLDDFARTFFGKEDGVWITNTYVQDEVIATLNDIAPFGWHDYFEERLHRPTAGAPLEGLERGGYRLVYLSEPSDYQKSSEAVYGNINLMFSLGVSLTQDGCISEVLWDGPAFGAGLTAGAKVLGVNRRAFSSDRIKEAVALSGEGKAVELLVQERQRHRQVRIDSVHGHRYPHLQPIPGSRLRLNEILSPRS